MDDFFHILGGRPHFSVTISRFGEWECLQASLGTSPVATMSHQPYGFFRLEREEFPVGCYGTGGVSRAKHGACGNNNDAACAETKSNLPGGFGKQCPLAEMTDMDASFTRPQAAADEGTNSVQTLAVKKKGLALKRGTKGGNA